MKKIILLLTLTIGLFQAANAQCTFTHTVSGNTATFTPVPFVVIGTTVMDSLVYDYGDGSGTFNIPLSQTSNSHTYAAPGTYNVCHTYHMHQLGNPNNTFVCTYCDSVTIGQPSSCITNIAATSNGNTITAIASASFGTAPYTYSYTLNPGNITNTTGIFSGLTLGTYTVCATATDALNQVCTSSCDTLTAGISFVCNTSLSLSASGNTVTATPTTTGGTAPYTHSYNLNPGNITNSSGVFTGLPNGQYTVCVTSFDALQNMCSTACDTVSVGTTTSCSVSTTATATGPTVTTTATATGGMAPYTYSYTLNPGSITNATGIFTGLANGNYSVCVTAFDAMQNLCSIGCDSVTVGNSVLCSTNISISTSGSTATATATSTGGTAPYSYSYTLSPGPITNSTGVFTGLANGSYTICVTSIDAMNQTCTPDCDSFFIGTTTGCMASIVTSVSGNTVTATGSATGGSGPYSYVYTLNPGSLSNSTGIFPGLANGSYWVCVTAIDNNQTTCSIACDSAHVGNVFGGCNVTANFSEIITGSMVNFTNSSTITNGTITNYSWAFGDGNFSTAPSPTHNYATAGPFNVVLVVNGVDSNQVPCVDSFSKTITVGPSSVNNVKANQLVIYPNPTAKNFTIELPTNEKYESVVITDVSGRVIATKTEKIGTKKLSIDIKNQSSGIYFIKLQTDENFYTSTLTKQE